MPLLLNVRGTISYAVPPSQVKKLEQYLRRLPSDHNPAPQLTAALVEHVPGSTHSLERSEEPALASALNLWFSESGAAPSGDLGNLRYAMCGP